MFQASWLIEKSQYNTNSIIQTMLNQKDSRGHGSSKRVVHLRALWVTKGFELTSSSLRKYTPWPTEATRSLFHRTRRSVPSQWTFAIFIFKYVNLQDLQKLYKSWVVLLAKLFILNFLWIFESSPPWWSSLYRLRASTWAAIDLQKVKSRVPWSIFMLAWRHAPLLTENLPPDFPLTQTQGPLYWKKTNTLMYLFLYKWRTIQFQ